MSKFYEGKYEPTLVYPSFIEAIAIVRRYGIEKHGDSEDWRSTPSIDHLDALGRHYLAMMKGEELAADSQLPHLYHLGCNVMFEIEREYGTGFAPFHKGRLAPKCNRCHHTNVDRVGDICLECSR
jgi:hypothetical protein